MANPIPFIWEGDGFAPVNRFWQRKCDDLFVVGQRYALEEVHERSHASHAHYFSVLREIWMNLPDLETDRFPNVEKMRKTALIHTGYRTETQYVCASNAEADKLARDLRADDDYQIIVVRGDVVTRYRAKSQDHRSMDKAEFQKSKQDVLDWCAALIGVDPATLASVRETA